MTDVYIRGRVDHLICQVLCAHDRDVTEIRNPGRIKHLVRSFTCIRWPIQDSLFMNPHSFLGFQNVLMNSKWGKHQLIKAGSAQTEGFILS